MKAKYNVDSALFIDGQYVQIRLPGVPAGSLVFVERLSIINSLVKAVFNADAYLLAELAHKSGESGLTFHKDGQVSLTPHSMAIFTDNTGVSYYGSRADSEVGEVLPVDWLYLAVTGIGEAGLGVGEVVIEYRSPSSSDLVAAQVAVDAM